MQRRFHGNKTIAPSLPGICAGNERCDSHLPFNKFSFLLTGTAPRGIYLNHRLPTSDPGYPIRRRRKFPPSPARPVINPVPNSRKLDGSGVT